MKKKNIQRILKRIAWLIDIILLPLVWVSAVTLKFLRKKGIEKFPLSKMVLLNVGVFPIRDHYYEPLFNPQHLQKPLSTERSLQGINWNISEQLEILKSFSFEREFGTIPENFVNDTTFHFKNGSYGSGDAEYWYNMIRLKKPKRIIEIGSGHSTKVARLAIEENQRLDSSYQCRHVCVEPYEMPWLEKIGVEVLRNKVEEMDTAFFKQLKADDFLFIDSSHVIRPQGDVLFEILEILPILNVGVIVHIHDIFSPRDYLKEWVVDSVRFWNEQYLLEAFLSFNSEWKIIGALNYLKHSHFSLLKDKCPRITETREPGGFYIIRI